MLVPFIEFPGVFEPVQVALLSRVLGRLADPAMTTEQQQALAAVLIMRFQAGLTDEDDLFASFSPDGPRAVAGETTNPPGV